MLRELRLRWLAQQFARPRGLTGRWLIAPWLDRISGEMRRLALERLQLAPGDDVLEIGFGGGALLAEALERTRGRVIGVDISLDAVARARRRLAGRAELIHASAEAVPLPDHSIDKAVSLNSIYFWPEPQAGLSELARVLRPGGRLVLGLEPPEELGKWRGSRFGFRAFAADEVEAMLEAAGFASFVRTDGRGRKPDCFLILSAERAHANERGDGRRTLA